MLLGLSELMRATLDRTPATRHAAGRASSTSPSATSSCSRRASAIGSTSPTPSIRPATTPGADLPAAADRRERASGTASPRKAGRCRLEIGAASTAAACASGARRRRRPAARLRPRPATPAPASRNIRARLQHLYGDRPSLARRGARGGGTLVNVDLPPSRPPIAREPRHDTAFGSWSSTTSRWPGRWSRDFVQADPDVASVIECGDARLVPS